AAGAAFRPRPGGSGAGASFRTRAALRAASVATAAAGASPAASAPIAGRAGREGRKAEVVQDIEARLGIDHGAYPEVLVRSPELIRSGSEREGELVEHARGLVVERHRGRERMVPEPERRRSEDQLRFSERRCRLFHPELEA